MKLSSGRFKKTNKFVDAFGASITFDKVLAPYDVKGSIAHVKMLEHQNIITEKDAADILGGLSAICKEVESGEFVFDIASEDVHMAIEKRLTKLVGTCGGKLHTARSRNDQVALDMRLYLEDHLKNICSLLLHFANVLITTARDNISIIMPGYTHMQIAQPILFSHWIMAYFQMFRRDIERFYRNICDIKRYCPLGAGAIAGTGLPINRHYTAEILGFDSPSENSIDTVSDRDFVLETLSHISLCMMHFSRLSEELILFSSYEFSFLSFADEFATGSSMMPQKKNPDVAELVRGKTGRVYGNLTALLATMKGLPLAYNKDMQEDKEVVFDSVETLKNILLIFPPMFENIIFNKDRMFKFAENGFSTATDLADYLVRKGIPFRRAHHAVGKAVNYAVKKGIKLWEIPLKTLKKFSNSVEEDVYECITLKASVDSRISYGGTAQEQVENQIKNAECFIEKYVHKTL